jgi:hypothetical protein
MKMTLAGIRHPLYQRSGLQKSTPMVENEFPHISFAL